MNDKRTPVSVRLLAVNAMLAAMCVVLGYVAIDLGTVKITFESLPILIAGLMFGPAWGAGVGLVGTLLSQLLKYGVSVTTPLWILPYVVCGLVAGIYAKKRGFELTQKQMIFIVVFCELLVTAFNTLALYVDSKVYGYYYAGIILGVLALRLVICVVKAVAFAYVLPMLIKPIKKVI
ncbi:MAG: folate family ECF transporter S component [Firmicutes bacterium]|nr:folate family ECF transporter S component [Bacillota bacterium]